MLEAFAERQTHAAENCFLGHGEDRTGVATDTADEIVHSMFELSLWHETIDHAKFQGALRGDRFTGQNKLERDFGSDEKRENGGSERRKNANADFRLRKARFRSGNHQITKSSELRASADGRTVHDADHRLANFQHSG